METTYKNETVNKTIALFGGSYDPITLAHIQVLPYIKYIF